MLCQLYYELDSIEILVYARGIDAVLYGTLTFVFDARITRLERSLPSSTKASA